MDDNRFFKFIWRFNAVMIAGAIILLGILVISEIFDERDIVNVVNVEPQDQSITETRRHSFGQKVNGHDLTFVYTHLDQTFDHGYSSKSSNGTNINVGLHDFISGQTVWVFKTDDQIINDIYTSRKTIGRDTVATAHFFTTVDADTNNDKRLSRGDKKSLWVSGFDGLNPARLLENLDSNPQFDTLNDDQVLVKFKTKGAINSAIYTISTNNLSSAHIVTR